MQSTTIFILAVIVVLLIAFTFSLWMGYNLLKKIQQDNAMKTREMEKLRGLVERQQQELSEMRDQLKLHDEVAMLQCQTEVTRASIASTSEMNDMELMEWIDSKMDETKMFCKNDLRLKEAAQKLGLTQKRLHQTIKTQSKYANLNEYLTEKRFLEACRLLKEQLNWTIDAVCEESGFNSRRTFHNVFREKLGLSPSQFRQSCSP